MYKLSLFLGGTLKTKDKGSSSGHWTVVSLSPQDEYYLFRDGDILGVFDS